jgi:hypothetical protein
MDNSNTSVKDNTGEISLEDILKDLNENIKKNNELLESLNKDKETERESSAVHISKGYVSKVGLLLRNYIPLIGEYLKKRYEASSLMHFVEGIDLCSDDVDTIV